MSFYRLVLRVSLLVASIVWAVPFDAAAGDDDVCWKKSYGRGAGYPLTHCRPGEEKNGALCYPACQPGYHGVGPVCWQGCRPGYKDTGAFCDTGVHIYAKGTSWCKGGCNPGYNDDGCFCRKHHVYAKGSHGRGAGNTLICAPGLEQNGALCYPPCKDGYYGVGPVCWQNCEGEMNVACGAMCADSGVACASATSEMVTAPLQMVAGAVSLVAGAFSGGAATLAIQAAKIGIRAAVTAAKLVAKAGAKAILKAGAKAAAKSAGRLLARKAAKKAILRALKKQGKKLTREALDKAADQFIDNAESGGGFTFDPKALADLDPTGIASTVMAFVKPMCLEPAEVRAKAARDAQEDREAEAEVERQERESADAQAQKAKEDQKRAELEAQRARDNATRLAAQKRANEARQRQLALEAAAREERAADAAEEREVAPLEAAADKAESEAAEAEAEAQEAEKVAQESPSPETQRQAREYQGRARSKRDAAIAAARRKDAALARHNDLRKKRGLKLRARVAKTRPAKGRGKGKLTRILGGAKKAVSAVSAAVAQKLKASAPITDLVAQGLATRVREAMEGARAACAQAGPKCFAQKLSAVRGQAKQAADALRKDMQAAVQAISKAPIAATPAGKGGRGASAATPAALGKLVATLLPKLSGGGKAVLADVVPGAAKQPPPLAKVFGSSKPGARAPLKFDPKVGINLAIGQRASQSSTAAGGAASRAVDGNADGAYGNRSVSHTSAEQDPFWQVDLGQISRIQRIKIFNRTDCCADRLGAFQVLVSSEPFESGSLATALKQKHVWAKSAQAKGRETTIDVDADGRFVRVQLPGKMRILSLAEVEVSGGPTNAKTVLAASKLETALQKTQERIKAQATASAKKAEQRELTRGLASNIATKVVAAAKELGKAPSSAPPKTVPNAGSRRSVVASLGASMRTQAEIRIPTDKAQAPIVKPKAAAGGQGVRAALKAIYRLSLNDYRAGMRATQKLRSASRTLDPEARPSILRTLREFQGGVHGAFRIVYLVRRMQLPALYGKEVGEMTHKLSAALTRDAGADVAVDASLEGVEYFGVAFDDARGALLRLAQNGARMLAASTEFVGSLKITRAQKILTAATRTFSKRLAQAKAALESLAEALAPPDDRQSDDNAQDKEGESAGGQ